MIKWKKHPEMVKFMTEFIPGHSESQIGEAFEKEFGIVLTRQQIKNFKTSYHCPSGTVGGRFEKGMRSWNKGKKMTPEMYEKAKHTMFKKGSIPVNHRPVGSERVTKDGYVEMKIAEPNKWDLKHRVIWKQYFGEIGKDECIVFLDGNPQNCDISNLRKIKRAELVRYNQDGLKSDIPELNEVALNIAKLEYMQHKKRGEQ